MEILPFSLHITAVKTKTGLQKEQQASRQTAHKY